jgi:ATP adenylyltransferase
MVYAGGETREAGCVFCNRLNNDRDVDSLIVYRGESVMVILNLYPYNTGHVMIVPYAHVQDLPALESTTLAEMADLTAALTTALRRILGCDGFNIGMNIGSAAGAGIAEHIHQHIVPRWNGDANFMPIVGSTKVLPETLPATYAKIRAEFCRERSKSTTATAVVFDTDLKSVLLRGDALPVIPLDPDVPVWRSLVQELREHVGSLQIAAWAGPDQTTADTGTAPAVAFITAEPRTGNSNLRTVHVDSGILSAITGADRQLIAASRERLSRS